MVTELEQQAAIQKIRDVASQNLQINLGAAKSDLQEANNRFSDLSKLFITAGSVAIGLIFTLLGTNIATFNHNQLSFFILLIILFMSANVAGIAQIALDAIFFKKSGELSKKISALYLEILTCPDGDPVRYGDLVKIYYSEIKKLNQNANDKPEESTQIPIIIQVTILTITVAISLWGVTHIL